MQTAFEPDLTLLKKNFAAYLNARQFDDFLPDIINW